MLRFLWQDGRLDFGAALKPTERLSSHTRNFVGGSVSINGRVDISIAKGIHPSPEELSYLIWRELDNGRNQDYVEDVEQLAAESDYSKLGADVEDTEPANNFGFMKEPHKELYPPAFRGERRIPTEVRDALKRHVLDAIEEEYKSPDDWIYFTIYGSGISYNWDEDGDFDIQMWVDYTKFQDGDTPVTQDDLLADVRRLVQSVNFPSFAELGLATDDSEGKMLIQYYPKPGTGSEQENLASKPYACYDLEKGDWIYFPEPLTPKFYGEAFVLLLPKAQDIAVQSEAALDELARNVTDWQFWTGMYNKYKEDIYLKAAEEAKDKAEQFKNNVQSLFEGVFQGRAQAYSPEGKGIKDERDLIQKLLEVWGIFQKLKHNARAPLPWDENELPDSPTDDIDKGTDENDDKSSSYHWNIVAQLQGLPQGAFGPNPHLQDLARSYMEQTGQDYNPPTDYAKVDPANAARIAQEYENAQHMPEDPRVAASYRAMANETLNQYHHLVNNGYQFEFEPEGESPYASPHDALHDLTQNKHLYVYPTSAGFGQEDEDSSNHPLLQDSGVRWNGKPVTHNDIFRAVHDVFGHAKEGVGFRANGEENAWRQHSAMYSDIARPAMTAETRGQNSWVNFGPYGEQNRKADQQSTIYADQKATILPDWVHYAHNKFENVVNKVTINSNYVKQVEQVDGDYAPSDSQGIPVAFFPSTGLLLVGQHGMHHFTMQYIYDRQTGQETGDHDDGELVNNGSRLYLNHTMLMHTRPYWLEIAKLLGVSEIQEWNGDFTTVSNIKVADWQDVQEKAQRYYQNGNVHILTNDPDHVVATVYGDVPYDEYGGGTGTYQTEIWKDDPNSNVITRWTCTCPWGEVSWGRTRQWKKFEGRPCAHATAVQWASQSAAQQIPQEQMTIPGMEPQQIPEVTPSVVRQPGQNLQQFGPTPQTPGGLNEGIPQPPPTPIPPPTPPPPPVPQPLPQPQRPPSHLTQPGEQMSLLDMPGTFSHIAAFRNGDMVRTKEPIWGQDNLGNNFIVPKGMEGEVIWSDDIETIAIFSIEINGPLEPFNVRVETDTDSFYADPKARPFKKR